MILKVKNGIRFIQLSSRWLIWVSNGTGHFFSYCYNLILFLTWSSYVVWMVHNVSWNRTHPRQVLPNKISSVGLIIKWLDSHQEKKIFFLSQIGLSVYLICMLGLSHASLWDDGWLSRKEDTSVRGKSLENDKALCKYINTKSQWTHKLVFLQMKIRLLELNSRCRSLWFVDHYGCLTVFPQILFSNFQKYVQFNGA